MIWNRGISPFNVAAWLLWLLAAMLGALLTRNPVYLGVIMAAAWLVSTTLARTSSIATGQAAREQSTTNSRGLRLLLRTVLGLLVLTALFKGLSLHIGASVLFTLPEEWPLFGGSITAEGLAYAGLDAISLAAMLIVFSAFSTGADYYALLRSAPPFMRQVGLITSIAITFVPQTITRFAEIREAQALRGHRIRRVGDLIPLVIPLLSGGMERSMDLAEAMEARGFSRNTPGARLLPPILLQGGIAGSLGLVLAGGAFLAFFARTPLVGWFTVAAGLTLLAVTLRAVSRRSRRTRYRRSIWREVDTLLAAPSIGVAAILLIYRLIAPAALVYDPLSTLHVYMPPFDPVLAIAFAALAAPALILRGYNPQQARPNKKAEVAGQTTELDRVHP